MIHNDLCSMTSRLRRSTELIGIRDGAGNEVEVAEKLQEERAGNAVVFTIVSLVFQCFLVFLHLFP